MNSKETLLVVGCLLLLVAYTEKASVFPWWAGLALLGIAGAVEIAEKLARRSS